MEIAESIYEGVVTTSYFKNIRAESNHNGLSKKKRVEAALSNTHPATDGISVRRCKRYVY